jgi:hypothetical protein
MTIVTGSKKPEVLSLHLREDSSSSLVSKCWSKDNDNTSNLVQVLRLLIFIWEVPASNLLDHRLS